MFRIYGNNEVVVQFTLLGDDDIAIAKVFDQLVKDTKGLPYDNMGTDGYRLRTLRYTTDVELGGMTVAINLTSVANPTQKFRRKPLTIGSKSALELAVMGLDVAIVLGSAERFRAAIGDVPVVALEEATLENLYDALNNAIARCPVADA